ncbi:MAG: J domain-containing protein [Spirochaetaceae bacterium]
MDILDRLSYLLRLALEEPSDARSVRGRMETDADWREAWQELDDYMRRASEPGSAAFGAGDVAGGGAGTGGPGEADRGAEAHAGRGYRYAAGSSRMPPEVRRAFETLEIEPGASLDRVRRQFRRELARYHPDRFASDPAKFRDATTVTRELIQSYRRIRDYYNARAAS